MTTPTPTDFIDPSEREQATLALARLHDTVCGVIRGKSDEVRLALCCMVAGGHLLIEDNPGTGKTSLAKALAGSIGGTVRRVQFTPDLLPSDITGVTVFNPATSQFSFRPGPTFSNVLVADEINRASPKTQAALLEVMEERQVTADGVSHPVPDPFMVVATQNPLDFQGTYPLPEVQLDRFAMKLSLGYAAPDAELEVLTRPRGTEQVAVRPALDVAQFRELVDIAGRVSVTAPLHRYVLALVGVSRSHRDLRLGVSTRGALVLEAIARASALSRGRGFVTVDDVKEVAVRVLAHRVAVTPEAEIDGLAAEAVVQGILDATPVPRLRDAGSD
jgi:MoxR-like ATPase